MKPTQTLKAFEFLTNLPEEVEEVDKELARLQYKKDRLLCTTCYPNPYAEAKKRVQEWGRRRLMRKVRHIYGSSGLSVQESFSRGPQFYPRGSGEEKPWLSVGMYVRFKANDMIIKQEIRMHSLEELGTAVERFVGVVLVAYDEVSP